MSGFLQNFYWYYVLHMWMIIGPKSAVKVNEIINIDCVYIKVCQGCFDHRVIST